MIYVPVKINQWNNHNDQLLVYDKWLRDNVGGQWSVLVDEDFPGVDRWKSWRWKLEIDKVEDEDGWEGIQKTYGVQFLNEEDATAFKLVFGI
jgi:hypothetical protein